ncbi:MAG: hypothetical protein R2800_07985 [Flavipsychrobacter sp.]
MKTLFTLLSLLCVLSAHAQTGKLMKQYYISGSLAIGKGDRSFADTSAWLEVGADTTEKGIIFPRVLLDSIKTEKRAMFVYDLQDSVLYHFDGSERVRYMTYKDTTFLKNNFLLQGGNTFGEPLEVGSNDNQPVDVVTNGNRVVRVFANGNMSIGGDTTTDNYALNIDGSYDDAVLHLHRGGQSTFLKTTTNNDNAYTHTLAIGNHRIKTNGYGVSFSASDNEDVPVGQDIVRVKNVYNSSVFTPLKVLGANEEPYLTVTGLGGVLLGTNNDQGYKLDINGNIHANNMMYLDIDNPAYEYTDAISIKGTYHSITKLDLGLYNYGAYLATNSLDVKTGSAGETTLEIRGTPPSAGSISVEGLYRKVDFKGGILGDGWQVYMPEGVWSYQHTAFPFQPIEFTGNTTNQGIKLHGYSSANALQVFGLTGNVAIGGIEADNGYDLEVEGITYTDSFIAKDQIVVEDISASTGLKVGDKTSEAADYYAFEVNNPSSYETKLTLRPSANASGFNSAYWSSISNTGYSTTINAGTYHDLIFKRGAFEVGRFSQSNSFLLGRTTHDGYLLDVNGATRVSSTLMVEGSLVFNQGNKTISITEGNTVYQPVSINIGRTNVLNTNDNGRHITIGNNNTGNTTKIWQYMIGQGNNLSTAQLGSYAFGDYNTITSGDTYQYIYGSNNTINVPPTSTSRGQFIIGSSNSISHKFSSIMGNNQSTTGDNQLIFADGNANTHVGGYRDVYFGSGPESSLSTGVGAPVTINASGGKGTDKEGGLLRLAAGKSTGAAIPSDLILATGSAIATGSTLQTLADRWYVKGETGRMSNNNTPTALLDLDGTTGYNQLRLRTAYTPTSSSDTNGEAGDVSWDDDYIYIKTSTGWKRSALTTF